jgi:hypothetical protein
LREEDSKAVDEQSNFITEEYTWMARVVVTK